MPQYQFVLKETAQGKATRTPTRTRREIVKNKGHAIFVELVPGRDVEEAFVNGFGHYTWVVDSPNIMNVIALIQECERHGFVTLDSGPTPILTQGDLPEIARLSDTMKNAFPDPV